MWYICYRLKIKYLLKVNYWFWRSQPQPTRSTMKNFVFIFLLFIALPTFAQDTISAGQAKDYVEMPMFVKGKVVSFKAAADGKTTNYLNIDRAYPNGYFTVVLSNSYLEQQKLSLQDLNQKVICVKGKITTYKDDPKQIPQIFNPESIAVLSK